MGLLSRLGQRSLGLAETLGGKMQSGAGRAMRDAVWPADMRGAYPGMDSFARAGQQMFEGGGALAGRGRARQVAMDLRAMAERGEDAYAALDRLKATDYALADEVETILMQTSGR